ncbi:MAG: HipA domain-containing protein [Candidatus Delongbacteria bacterium]|nr:HipA domain-containing protein [Candidatus Delongbacteria bacterium]
MTRCLYCYQPLHSDEKDFHSSCCKKIFGQSEVPVLPYREDQFEDLATEIIKTSASVTGVQSKISLHLGKGNKDEATKRFTLVGLWGAYILKPPSKNYPQLPEVEDLTMHLAQIAKIKVVPHSLIRLQSGNLAYITKRIDREKNRKLHMEDMCQLTERLTEDKYNGSYEQIAKAINKYSIYPGLDVVSFCEIVLFSFLTGNADMHLKNFSLFEQSNSGMALSPAYDLLATAIVNPTDDEDLALTLNGKKKKIIRDDFLAAFSTIKLEEKQQLNIFNKMTNAKQSWIETVRISFLTNEFKLKFIELIEDRFERLGL